MGKKVILRKTLLVISALTVIVPQGSSFESPKTNWAKKLDYRQIELYPIKLQVNFIPLVEVKVNDFPLWVIFDTGCSTGFSLTSAVEKKIGHLVTGKSTERNPDGSYRGETTLATISSLEVFGDKYSSVKTSSNRDLSGHREQRFVY